MSLSTVSVGLAFSVGLITLSKAASPFENPNESFSSLKSGLLLKAPLPKLNLTYASFPLNPGNY